MTDQAKLLSLLFDYLNQHTCYALLRNYQSLPEHNNSRDIDIAIKHKDYNKHFKNLINIIEQADWKIVTYLKSDRLITWVCGKISKTVELIQLDFFFHTSIFGLILIDNNSLLKHRLYNGKIYHVDTTYEFLDKYLYNRAAGANYPKKYYSLRKQAESLPETVEVLKRLFKSNTIEECDNTNKKTLLYRLLKQNLSQYGLKVAYNSLAFYYYHIKNYLCSNTGFSIGFTGPDGSGKTTVIDLMIKSLGDVFRKAHVYFHFRPMLFSNLGEVAHSAGIKKDVDRDYDKPHRGGKTGVLSSILRLLYYSTDYIIGYFLKVKPITRITRLVIFDRYFTDIICDSRRSRIYLPVKFLYWFGKFFIPSLNYNILLTADTETILNRKRELDRNGIEQINNKINFLANKPRFYKITNDNSPQETVAEIIQLVFEKQHQKNLKRISL